MRTIPLYDDNSDVVAYTTVDDADYARLVQSRWYLSNFGYVVRAGRDGEPKTVAMHREVLNAADGEEVDHRNRDKLDNRKDNLRQATRQQNNRNRDKGANNTSGYKGVSLNHGKWQAHIRVDGKLVYIGRHNTQEAAARAYDKAALELHGDFACINFPEEH